MGITYTTSVGMVVTDLNYRQYGTGGGVGGPPHQQVAPAVILPESMQA